jgi:hypothetical protein
MPNVCCEKLWVHGVDYLEGVRLHELRYIVQVLPIYGPLAIRDVGQVGIDFLDVPDLSQYFLG